MEMNNHYVDLPRLFSRFTEIRYINGWIIFSVDLVISLCVSLIGVLGIFSFLGVSYAQEDVVKVGFASFVGSLVAFFTFKVYRRVIRHSTLRGLWRIWGVAILKSVVLCILLLVLKTSFTPKVYLVGLFIDCVLTMLMLVTFRIFIVNIYNMVLLQLGKKRKRVLVYGTGDESVMIASTATRHIFMQDYSITGFITFNKQKKNFRIAELPVYQIASREDLLKLVNRISLDGVLFPNLKTIQQEKERLIRFVNKSLCVLWLFLRWKRSITVL